MPKVRVLRGTYRKEDGTRAEPGDIIEVSQAQYERLNPQSYEKVSAQSDNEEADSETDAVLESEDEQTESEEEPEPEADSADSNPSDGDTDLTENVTEDDSDDNPLIDHPSVTSDDVPDVEASGEVPDDYATLSKMAKHYDGDEVHGSSSKDEMVTFFESLSDTEIASLKDKAESELSDN